MIFFVIVTLLQTPQQIHIFVEKMVYTLFLVRLAELVRRGILRRLFRNRSGSRHHHPGFSLMDFQLSHTQDDRLSYICGYSKINDSQGTII